MRIISKFHDYYDCIQRLGQDRTVVYLRNPKVIKGWPFPSCRGTYKDSWTNPLTKIRMIGFCGKIIPLVELFDEVDSDPIRCWSLGEVDAFMKARLNTKAWTAYWKSRWARGCAYSRDRKSFKKFFDNCAQHENSYENLFRENHSPLFIATSRVFRTGKSEIVFNACLKDVEFYTRFDTYQAFQEIAMYMGGILGTHGGHKTKYKGKMMSSEVSDRDLAAAKGFDKYSFRKSK